MTSFMPVGWEWGVAVWAIGFAALTGGGVSWVVASAAARAKRWQAELGDGAPDPRRSMTPKLRTALALLLVVAALLGADWVVARWAQSELRTRAEQAEANPDVLGSFGSAAVIRVATASPMHRNDALDLLRLHLADTADLRLAQTLAEITAHRRSCVEASATLLDRLAFSEAESFVRACEESPARDAMIVETYLGRALYAEASAYVEDIGVDRYRRGLHDATLVSSSDPSRAQSRAVWVHAMAQRWSAAADAASREGSKAMRCLAALSRALATASDSEASLVTPSHECTDLAGSRDRARLPTGASDRLDSALAAAEGLPRRLPRVLADEVLLGSTLQYAGRPLVQPGLDRMLEARLATVPDSAEARAARRRVAVSLAAASTLAGRFGQAVATLDRLEDRAEREADDETIAWARAIRLAVEYRRAPRTWSLSPRDVDEIVQHGDADGLVSTLRALDALRRPGSPGCTGPGDARVPSIDACDPDDYRPDRHFDPVPSKAAIPSLVHLGQPPRGDLRAKAWSRALRAGPRYLYPGATPWTYVEHADATARGLRALGEHSEADARRVIVRRAIDAMSDPGTAHILAVFARLDR